MWPRVTAKTVRHDARAPRALERCGPHASCGCRESRKGWQTLSPKRDGRDSPSIRKPFALALRHGEDPYLAAVVIDRTRDPDWDDPHPAVDTHVRSMYARGDLEARFPSAADPHERDRLPVGEVTGQLDPRGLGSVHHQPYRATRLGVHLEADTGRTCVSTAGCGSSQS